MNTTERTVLAVCPTCKKKVPHKTAGITVDAEGRRCQSMECRACGTVTKVYEDPDDGFQVNYDWPDGSED